MRKSDSHHNYPEANEKPPNNNSVFSMIFVPLCEINLNPNLTKVTVTTTFCNKMHFSQSDSHHYHPEAKENLSNNDSAISASLRLCENISATIICQITNNSDSHHDYFAIRCILVRVTVTITTLKQGKISQTTTPCSP